MFVPTDISAVVLLLAFKLVPEASRIPLTGLWCCVSTLARV
jgi:hypothetical protein